MQTEATWNDSGIDLSNLLSRVEYDRDLLIDLLLVFKHEFPQTCRSLKDAIDRGDRTQVQISAHTLKGMLSSLSFVKATALAVRIERTSHDPAMTGIEDDLRRLEQESAAAQLSLATVCEGEQA